MIDVILPAGFTPADFTLVFLIATFAETKPDNPARSASAIIDASPAKDTRPSSSNFGVALDQP